MKWLLALAGIGLVLFLGISAALQTGVKSPVFVAGTLELPGALVPKAAGINTLYIVIYDLDNPAPMPFGATRLKLKDPVKAGKFYNFVVTKEKLQIMGGENAPFPKRMRVKARLDRDSLGGRDQAGDVVGEVTGIEFGSSGVNIPLDRLIGKG